MAEAEIATPLSPRRIVLLTASAAAVAALIFTGGVLPAEYHRDPIGLGRLTGIDRLWAPEEKVVSAAGDAAAPASRSYPVAFRTDVIDIPLHSGEDPAGGADVEYKVHLKKGGSYIYSWSVGGIDNPEEFYTEFHGHTVEAGKAMTVAFYRKATGTSDNGVLTAPFDGVHGWLFQNQSIKPVTVHLRLAGFYELVPDGQPGNEAGLHARRID